MTETLNSNEAAGRSEYEEAMSDAPAFDKEAALAAYKAEHPDAVEDIEKARFMAEAGNKYETMAVNRLKDAVELVKETGNTIYDLKEGGAKYRGMTGMGNVFADPRGDDFTQDINESPDAIAAARDAIKKADDAEKNAGERYEKLQEVKGIKIDDLRKSQQ